MITMSRNHPTRTLNVIDMFCGAGGLSLAAERAAKHLGLKVKFTAVNHWEVAIATYQANHQDSTAICDRVEMIDPLTLDIDGDIDLLLAGPECIFFSRAGGNRPVNSQSRASAWRILEWIERLGMRGIKINRIGIENVPEFRKWGPLKEVVVDKVIKFGLPLPSFDRWYPKMRAKGGTKAEWQIVYDQLSRLDQAKRQVSQTVTLTCCKPIKEREGETFMAFINGLKSFGYEVDWKILKAANHGDATSRERLFIQASLVGKISWPKPTHASPEKIAPAQVAQISLLDSAMISRRGLQPYRTAADILDMSDPGESIFTRQRPLSINTLRRLLKGLEKFCGIHMLDRQGLPLEIGVINDLVLMGQPFLLKYYGGQFGEPINKPVPTICANYEHYALVTPKLDPFIVEFRGNMNARRLGEPLTTIATSGAHHGLAQPVIIPVHHGEKDLRCYPTDRAFPTITSFDAWAMVQAVKKPFIVKYYGTGIAVDPERDPLDTITTRDRFGLVTPQIVEELREGEMLFWLDILFRMLKVEELAEATSFPRSYHFKGKKREDNVKLIGNAVPVFMGTALCDSILTSYLKALPAAA